jgi:hypothetical protein
VLIPALCALPARAGTSLVLSLTDLQLPAHEPHLRLNRSDRGWPRLPRRHGTAAARIARLRPRSAAHAPAARIAARHRCHGEAPTGKVVEAGPDTG